MGIEYDICTKAFYDKPMTLGDLRALLAKYPDDMPVCVDYDSMMDSPGLSIRWMVLMEKGEWRDAEHLADIRRDGTPFFPEDVKQVLVFR